MPFAPAALLPARAWHLAASDGALSAPQIITLYSKRWTIGPSFRDPAQVDDEYTRTNYAVGQFHGTGKVHFSDEPHLRDLFSRFEIILMEEKLIRRIERSGHHRNLAGPDHWFSETPNSLGACLLNPRRDGI